MRSGFAAVGFVVLSSAPIGAGPGHAPPPAAGLATRSGGDWPGFLGPHGDASVTEELPSLAWGPAGPRLVWQADAGEGYGMPAVREGRLFLFDRVDDRARLRCLAAETGEELWRSEYATDYEDDYGFSNGPRTTPVVDEERVCTFGVEGRLRCHSVVDGALLWQVDTASRFGVVKNFFGVGSSPTLEGGLLIVQVGGTPPGSGIVAFDRRTGDVRYAITDELASYSTPVFATIGERRFGFVLARGGLVGFEPASGRVDFHFPWRAAKRESVNAANAVVVGDTVFVSESYGPGGALVRVRPGGYDVIRRDGPARNGGLRAHWATPVHRAGYLYGSSGSGSGDAELRAVNLATGEVAWRVPGLGRATVLLAGSRLIVLGEFGRLIVAEASPERFHVLADADLAQAAGRRPALRAPAWNGPALARGLLYVRGRSRLFCFELIPDAAAERPAVSDASKGGAPRPRDRARS